MFTKKNVLVTTSREPTDKIRTFCNDIAHAIPSVVRVNRGKLSLDGVAEKALELNADRVIIIDRWKRGFAVIRFYRIGAYGLTLSPPVIYIASIRFQRSFEVRAKRVKTLAVVMPLEISSEAKRLGQSIGEFFGIPIFVDQDKVSGSSAAMHISSNLPDKVQMTFVIVPTLVETGPRISISKIIWEELK